MPVTLKSTNKAAIVLEIAELLRAAESALNPVQDRVTINYGNSNATPRVLTITATLPTTFSRVAADGGSKFIYSNYTATDSLVLTGTPLEGMAVESLAEALGVSAEELDISERAKISSGVTLPTGVGTDVSYANLEATITCALAYTVAIDASGRPYPVVTNHVA